MKDLENELRAALRRGEPAPDFTNRVLARIASAPAPKLNWQQSLASLFRTHRLRWAVAGVVAALVIAIGVVQYRHVQRERAEGEAAKAQLMQALHIASTKLNVTWKKVQEADRRPPRT